MKATSQILFTPLILQEGNRTYRGERTLKNGLDYTTIFGKEVGSEQKIIIKSISSLQ